LPKARKGLSNGEEKRGQRRDAETRLGLTAKEKSAA